MQEFSKEYFRLLNDDYKSINLTRINDYEEFKNKQIDDSIAPYEQSSIFREGLLETGLMIDVGFGGGFPILPMAKLNPKNKFIGIETRGKKVKVVGEIAAKLSLKNVKLYHSRIENILIDKECICTFKAVGKVNDFLSKINTIKTIQVYFYKGPGFYELEKEQFEKAKESWKVIEEKVLRVEGVEKRYLIGFENINTTISPNNLVKLSDIL